MLVKFKNVNQEKQYNIDYEKLKDGKNNLLYKLLSLPLIYHFSQFIMSATSYRNSVIKKYVKKDLRF